MASNSSMVTFMIFFNKKIGNFLDNFLDLGVNSNDFSNYFWKNIGKFSVSKNLGKKKKNNNTTCFLLLSCHKKSIEVV